jgi:hypothetical protein
LKYCINCGMPLHDGISRCGICGTEQPNLNETHARSMNEQPSMDYYPQNSQYYPQPVANKRPFYRTVPGIAAVGLLVVFLLVIVLALPTVLLPIVHNAHSPVMVTRPATEIIITPSMLGPGWSGSVGGDKDYANLVLFDNGYEALIVQVTKFASFTEAAAAYDIDVNGSTGQTLDIGENGKMVSKQYSSELVFYRGNVVVILTNMAMDDSDMILIAQMQNDRISEMQSFLWG